MTQLGKTVNMTVSELLSVAQLYGSKIKPAKETFGLWFLLENMKNMWLKKLQWRTYTHKKEIWSSFISYTCEKFGKLVSGRHEVKAKSLFPLHGKKSMAERVSNIIGTSGMQDLTMKFRNPVAVTNPYKVDFARCRVVY